ncbi:MAG: UpxY family transcription antiterminator [Melioribacteraceae bacterium]|nr:UpxY family transcription antiterminator [Melioribacteraceae bacterium]
MEIKKWFALYTKPRHEFKALAQLNEIEVEAYLPTITVTKQWSDRKKKVTEPLFKSYIFIFANEVERNRAVTREAVIKTIYFDGKPAVIPDQEMDSIRKMLESPEKIQVFNGIVKGVIVKITSGPFEGIEGIVRSISDDENTLSVSIQLLNRTVSVSIAGDTEVKRIN